MDQETSRAVASDSLNCTNCGALLHFVPGTHSLKCDYCGVANNIRAEKTVIEAVDYDTFIRQEKVTGKMPGLQSLSCKGCGSQTVFKENIIADKCPFCASPLVLGLDDRQQVLRPHYVLPFAVDRNAAARYFQQWLKGLWFAPGDLLKKVNGASSSPLQGVYMPYFAYNTDTVTDYTGQRGEYYYTTEPYTVTVNGKTETRTRQVRHTRWHYTSGTVRRSFKDVTVPSSRSLPQKTMLTLGPWDFGQLETFDERYLSGFRSETFQAGPEETLETAKQLIAPDIEAAIIDDIGGDEQRIDEQSTMYNNLGIKYIMLPVWVSSYNYNKKPYQFTINACTGEVIGQRPLSWIKITLTVLAGLILVAVIWLLVSRQQGNG
ncbi:hypothetical protein [Hufsiella ginkgonis]|uniref:DNA helicase PriA n=1 Tax=Hufsiella ginkgonis TaxID=2695274 RepID=A0A7K1XX97_9SPHI|nr:hypothetical protein [Hufsiella ginkgonis]MXV15634.1 hypothetical protein [Hufsiella ginkgonis]